MSYRRTLILLILLLSFTIYNYVVRGLAENAGEFSWPMFRGNLRRTGYSTASPNTDKLWWRFSGSVRCSPAVAGGRVFIGIGSNIYALDEQTGAKMWNYTTGGPVSSSPAIADDMLFIGSHDYNIYALNTTTGTKIWSFKTGYSVDSSPAVANGMVFFGSHDHNLYVLDEMTGEEIWKYHTDAEVFHSPAVVGG